MSDVLSPMTHTSYQPLPSSLILLSQFESMSTFIVLFAAALSQLVIHSAHSEARQSRLRPAELYNFNFEPFTEKQLWPGGIVSYRFDGEYPLGWMRDLVVQAFDQIDQLSCIRFQRVNESYTDSFVRVTNGELCSSQVGRLTNVRDGQVLSLPEWCLRRPEGALHEIMHALGFGHEQSRTDRNKYLLINWDNIPKDAWYLFSAGSDAHALLGYRIPYDYASILHYGPNYFAIREQAILTSTEPHFHTRINYQMSALDVLKLNAVYQCDVKMVVSSCADYLPECRTISNEQCFLSSYARDVCQASCKSCRELV